MRAAALRRFETRAGGRLFSFFAWFASLVGGSSGTLERVRKRGLKRLARAIAVNPYRRFFQTKSGRATPDMAQFFYDIYRTVAPAQPLLRNAATSTRLKKCVVTGFLEPAQRELAEGLSAAGIARREETLEAGILSRRLQGEFAELERAFDAGRSSAINECYRLVLIVCQFVMQDHYGLLKKFDPQLTERCLSNKPNFGMLRGEAVVEELKDFLELAVDLDPNRDWSAPLLALKEFLGMEALNLNAWNAMLLKIRAFAVSEICELLIRFIERDPGWTWTPHAMAHEGIVASFLEQTKEEIVDRLALAAAAKQNAVIENHAAAVFGASWVSNRLKYYTEQEGELFRKKHLAGYVDARALNYLFVFLTDVRSELQSLYELIIIQGHWVSTALSFPLSETLRLLAAFPARIAELDEMFSEWGVYGARLKTALANTGRDKNREQTIARRLDSANRAARQIVADALFDLSALTESLKELLEDCRKESGTIILNWDKLNSLSKTRLEGRLAVMGDRLSNMQ